MTKLDDGIWLAPPANIALTYTSVHVWRAALDRPPEAVADLERVLAPDERERAARFYFERDRRHFIVGRGLLRTILGRYLGVPGAQLAFSYNRYGKPQLAVPFDTTPLQFNVSHSRGLALYACTSGREIGVDIEAIRPLADAGQVAAHTFSPHEQAALLALPPEQQLAGFFACWTRKEAYIKARGAGLSLPLGQFDVSLAPGEPARLLTTRDDPAQAARWSLHELVPGAGYMAALAVEGRGWQLACWQWPF